MQFTTAGNTTPCHGPCVARELRVERTILTLMLRTVPVIQQHGVASMAAVFSKITCYSFHILERALRVDFQGSVHN